jgi:hypothetical protein
MGAPITPYKKMKTNLFLMTVSLNALGVRLYKKNYKD